MTTRIINPPQGAELEALIQQEEARQQAQLQQPTAQQPGQAEEETEALRTFEEAAARGQASATSSRQYRSVQVVDTERAPLAGRSDGMTLADLIEAGLVDRETRTLTAAAQGDPGIVAAVQAIIDAENGETPPARPQPQAQQRRAPQPTEPQQTSDEVSEERAAETFTMLTSNAADEVEGIIAARFDGGDQDAAIAKLAARFKDPAEAATAVQHAEQHLSALLYDRLVEGGVAERQVPAVAAALERDQRRLGAIVRELVRSPMGTSATLQTFLAELTARS